MAGRPTAIVSLSARPDYIKFLVYSESGSGKTVMVGSADTPETSSKALIIGVEEGTISAKRQGSTADLWPVESWADIQKAYKWLKETPNHGYDWIGIDSLTEMRELGLNNIVQEAVANNSNRDPDVPAIQDYGKINGQMKKMVNSFNLLPVNVIYTAHIDKPEDFDEEEEDDLTHPAMPLIPGKKGQVQQYICGTMHVVGYLGVVPERTGPDPDDAEKTITVPERRILLCKTTKRYFGKDRFDSLERGRLANPTIPLLEEKIKEAMPSGKAAKAEGGAEEGAGEKPAKDEPAKARRRS